MASIYRNDPKDRRLADAFKRNYELITRKKEYDHTGHYMYNNRTMKEALFYLEDVEIKQINGKEFPALQKWVEISQLWMSDHAHFWYFLHQEAKVYHIYSEHFLFIFTGIMNQL